MKIKKQKPWNQMSLREMRAEYLRLRSQMPAQEKRTLISYGYPDDDMPPGAMAKLLYAVSETYRMLHDRGAKPSINFLFCADGFQISVEEFAALLKKHGVTDILHGGYPGVLGGEKQNS